MLNFFRDNSRILSKLLSNQFGAAFFSVMMLLAIPDTSTAGAGSRHLLRDFPCFSQPCGFMGRRCILPHPCRCGTGKIQSPQGAVSDADGLHPQFCTGHPVCFGCLPVHRNRLGLDIGPVQVFQCAPSLLGSHVCAHSAGHRRHQSVSVAYRAGTGDPARIHQLLAGAGQLPGRRRILRPENGKGKKETIICFVHAKTAAFACGSLFRLCRIQLCEKFLLYLRQNRYIMYGILFFARFIQ